MSEKINIRKIFINSKFNKIPLTLEEEDIVLKSIDTWYTIEDIEKAMLEFGKQLLALAADKADWDCDMNHTNITVNKQSIINTINEVE